MKYYDWEGIGNSKDMGDYHYYHDDDMKD